MLSLFRPRWRAYALAILLTVAALLTRMGLRPLLLDGSKMLIFLVAVLGVASLGGLGPGLLATALSCLLASWFLMQPVGSLAIEQPGDGVQLIVFATIGTVVSFTINAAHRAVQRERAQALAFRQTEARFKAIVSQASAGVGMCDRTGRFTLVNPRFCEMLGYSEAELLAMRMQDVTHAEDLPKNVEQFQALLAGGPDFHMEKRYLRKGGGIIWVNVSVGAVLEDRQVAQVLAVAHDITSRKADEEALRYSESRFRLLVEQLPLSVQVFERDGRLARVNRAWEKLYGVTFVQLADYNILQDPQLVERGVMPLIQRAFAGETVEIPPVGYVPNRGDYRGRQRWTRSIVYPLLGEDGAAREVVLIHEDITTQKTAEDQLRRNHDTFYHLIQNNPFGIYIVDADFRLRQVSLGAQNVFSHVRPLLGRDFAEILRIVWSEPFASEAIGRFRRTLETGEPYSAMRTIERRGDVEAVEAYDWRIERITLPDGRFGVVCYFYDLSERERLEAALRSSEERFQLAARATNDAIWDWNIATNELWWNEGVQTLFGYAPEEISPTTTWYNEKIHPEERERVIESLRAVIRQGGVAWREEYRFRRADGKYADVLDRGYVIRNGEGKATRMIGAMQDLTERKTSEVALRKSEERLRLATQTGKVGVWDWDIATSEVAWSDSLFAIHGVQKENFRPTATGFASLVHPEDQARVGLAMQQTAAHGERYETSFRAVRPDGEVIWLFTNGIPVQRDGKTVRVIGATVDITELKRAEEALRENEERLRAARDQAEAASRAKDQFMAALSHELRNPLNPVLLTASEMLHDPTVTGGAREAWTVVRQNVALEAALIDDLLDLTGIAQGKVTLHSRALDVHQVLRDALATVQETREQKRITLDLHFTAERPVVHGDPVRLQQVFWNVLSNAVKFTPPGGSIRVHTRIAEHRGFIVEIADTGMGMTPQELGRLFEAFQQGDHADQRGSHRFGGLGLGMAICQRLVQMHGGEIRAESAGRGEGSQFTITLPPGSDGASDLLPEANAPKAALSNSAPAPDGQPAAFMQVLLVEDHDPTRTTLAALLRRRGYEVIIARTAAEAREAASNHRFALLLSDLGLPDGDGHALMRELREKHTANLVGIAISGYGMPEDIRRSMEAGFSVHLTKPVEIEALDAALRQALTLH